VKQPDLSIVIPALSEERRIGLTLDELAKYLKFNSFFKDKTVEVLVVAADTKDKTHKIILARQKQFKDLQLFKPGPRVGKGRDVQYGMLRAGGKVVIYMDADLATPLHHLEEFYKACSDSNVTGSRSDKGYDIVIGTRNLRTYRSNKFRNIFSSFGNKLYRIAGGVDVEDTQCGFKMFTSHATNLCFSKLTILGWGFDIELLAIAKANNLKLKSIRIDDWEDKPYSTYTEKPISIAKRMTVDSITIAINKAKGRYVDK
jgi:dolichyl-phosphate beta-glucosyltransferase